MAKSNCVSIHRSSSGQGSEGATLIALIELTGRREAKRVRQLKQGCEHRKPLQLDRLDWLAGL